MRVPGLVAALSLLAAPLAAQHQHHGQPPSGAGPEGHPPAKAELPAGWEMRLDRPGADLAGFSFKPMEPGWHITTGPAAILYRPDRTASGAFRLEATTFLFKGGEALDGVGLFAGGRNLTGEDQDYLYFLIRRDGKFLVKHRGGPETHVLVDWTEHGAIQKAGADGQPVKNVLGIDTGGSGIDFYVNGQKVVNLPPHPHLKPLDGVYGLRVNHRLDVHVTDLKVTQKPA